MRYNAIYIELLISRVATTTALALIAPSNRSQWGHPPWNGGTGCCPPQKIVDN